MLDLPLRTAEFLVVDTETNGRPGEACELTEIGAVLVGGGELHDRWETLVQVRAPLGRGIQRFTGITQQMVDGAPPAELALPELAEQLEGRVLVAHSAAFDVRVLRQAFERAGLAWPDPPALCTVALTRRFAPLVRRRKLGEVAAALGIEVEVAHRALADAETCARVFCALLPRLSAGALTVGDALASLRPARRRRVRAGATDGAPKRAGVRRRLPDLSGCSDEPGVYVIRNEAGQPLYVGKSIGVRTRVRQHFAPSAREGAWVAQAEHVEHERTHSELGALLLEQRLIGALQPPGNVRGRPQDRWVYLRCRLDIAFPVLEVAPEPAEGRAISIGPLASRSAAVELLEQLNSLFGLRHCGRRLPSRRWPSAYGQMGRCLSPCLGDLDPNAYRERLDEALALAGAGDRALVRHLDRLIRAEAAAQRFERAAWLRRRRERMRWLLDRLGEHVEATHARPQLALAPHPDATGAFDAVWLAGGRVMAWGPLEACDVAAATARALAQAGEGPPVLRAAEVAEARIAHTWLAAHPEAPRHELSAPEAAARWVLAVTGGRAAAGDGIATYGRPAGGPAAAPRAEAGRGAGAAGGGRGPRRQPGRAAASAAAQQELCPEVA